MMSPTPYKYSREYFSKDLISTKVYNHTKRKLNYVSQGRRYLHKITKIGGYFFYLIKTENDLEIVGGHKFSKKRKAT